METDKIWGLCSLQAEDKLIHHITRVVNNFYWHVIPFYTKRCLSCMKSITLDSDSVTRQTAFHHRMPA